MEHLHYPNESDEYRAARNALLDDEIALRAQIEAVAAKRRALPLGGEVPEPQAALHGVQISALYLAKKAPRRQGEETAGAVPFRPSAPR
jgi:Bacterial protein of unknown function (DUF899)